MYAEGHLPKEPIFLLPHCLLNQKVRAERAYTPGVTQRLLGVLSHYTVWLEQLPCPEFSFVGERERKPKDEWERLKGFREHCSNLADEIDQRIREFRDGGTPFFLVSIARSASCSSSEVYRGERVLPGKGILVEELEKRVKPDFVEFDFKRLSWSLERIERRLRILENYESKR